MRLRNALEIEHMAIFFRANAYFQIKSNEDMTKPDTLEFEALEKLETEGYDEAKKLRREILQEVSDWGPGLRSPRKLDADRIEDLSKSGQAHENDIETSCYPDFCTNSRIPF